MSWFLPLRQESRSRRTRWGSPSGQATSFSPPFGQADRPARRNQLADRIDLFGEVRQVEVCLPFSRVGRPGWKQVQESPSNLRWLGLANESSRSFAACSCYRSALTGCV